MLDGRLQPTSDLCAVQCAFAHKTRTRLRHAGFATIIQRAWRRYAKLRIFQYGRRALALPLEVPSASCLALRYYRDLVRFAERSEPQAILKARHAASYAKAC